MRHAPLKSAAGLMLALFALPLISLAFALVSPLTHMQVFLREALMWLSAMVLLLYTFRYESSTWRQLGLGRSGLVETTGLVLAGLVLMTLVVALANWLVGQVTLFNLAGEDGPATPLWFLALISLRAGALEELFYRGYAINRLQILTGRRWLAMVVPLLVFSLLHSPQGLRGMLIAFLAGAVLTALFLWKRNLWACMIVHFLVDYAPDALLAWYGF